jgi:DNA-binding GntR family transcriptional regulator
MSIAMQSSQLQGPGAQGPKYLQIQNQLTEWIRTRYRAGDLLPTQIEIARQTSTSLITVKRAISELARIGLVESIPGRGAVVKRPVVTDLRSGISSWTHSVGSLGERPQTVWTKIEERVPDARVRHLLSLGRREKTVRVRRLRAIRGQPISFMSNELPRALVPELLAQGLRYESLYECLRRDHGVVPHRASEEVIARQSTEEERGFLGKYAAVVLVVERLTLQKNGVPMEVSQSVNRGDLYHYQVQLFADLGSADQSKSPRKRNTK